MNRAGSAVDPHLLRCPVGTEFHTEVRSLAFARSAVTLVIQGRATLDEVRALRLSVLTAVAQTTADVLVLSLGEVESMDSAGAAVLVEAIEIRLRGRRNRNRPSWKCCSVRNSRTWTSGICR